MIGMLRRWLGRGEARGLHPRDPALAGWFGAAEAASGMVVTPDTAMRATAVFACVQYLARSIAAMPLILYRRLPDGGKARDYEHPLARVLHDQPNSWQTAYEFRAMLQAHLSLRGNAYARIVAANGNPVAALLPLHPDRVRPLPERVGGRLAYEYFPRRGAREVLLQEEVLHLRGLSLAEDGVIGLSPLDCMREAVGLALAAEAYGARFYRNNARPGIVLKHPGRLSPDAGKRLKESWNSQYAGAENAHKTAVLEEGMDLISVGMTAEQAQFLETRKFQRNEIAAIFGVPPHKIGDLERATFSNIEHQAIEVVTDTIRPWAVAWEQAMTRDLFTEDLRRTHMLAFNLDGLLRGDIESRYRAYATGRQWGWLSANDVREREDMNRIDGGDLYLAPVNMTPAEKLAAAVGEIAGGSQGKGAPMELERRMVQAADLRVMAEGPPRIVGHAALFDILSDDLGGFRERIRPGAFAASLVADDVRALFNHDPNVILGRNRAGTLRLTEDERGLGIEIDPPDTQAARDLMVSIARGDVSQMSFGFSVAPGGQVWEKHDQGGVLRTLTAVRLFDVSPVVFPAYPDTAVAVRALDAWRDSEPSTIPIDMLRRRLDLALIATTTLI